MHEMPANTGCTGLFDRSWACPEPKKILGNIRNACEMAVSGPRKLAKVQLSPSPKTPIAELQAFPPDGKSVSQSPNPDRAWVSLARYVEEVARDLRSAK